MLTHIDRRLEELCEEIESIEQEIKLDAVDPAVSDLWFTTEVTELTELQNWRDAIVEEHADVA